MQLFGTPVSRGVAIGRAVLVASSRVDVAHYFIAEDRVEFEIERLRHARDTVAAELGALKRDLVEVLTQCQMDDAVRVVLFIGSGRAFSAGDDISAM